MTHRDTDKSPEHLLASARVLTSEEKPSALERLLDDAVQAHVEVPPEALVLLPQWTRLGRILDTWYKKPLDAEDGWTLAQMTAFEKEREEPYWKDGLHRFPSAVWQFYYLLGHRLEGSMLYYEAELYRTKWSALANIEPTHMEFRAPNEVGSLSDEDVRESLEDDADDFEGDAQDYLICAEGAWSGSVAFLQLLSELKPGARDPRTWIISLEEVGGARAALPFSAAITRLVEMDLHCLRAEVLEQSNGCGCLGELAPGVRHIALPGAVEILGATDAQVFAFEHTPLRQALAPLGLDDETLSRVVLQGEGLLVANEVTRQVVEQRLAVLRSA